MLDLRGILDQAKKSFLMRKKVDFDEKGLHFELGPLSSFQETLVTEKCVNLEGVDYFDTMKRVTLSYSIKKINDIDLDVEEVEVSGEEKPVKVNEYLEKEISAWPAPLKDKLFEAYSNLYDEIEAKVNEGGRYKKFERPKTEEEEDQEREEFKEVEETDDGIELTPTEKMGKEVEKEIERENQKIASQEV